MIRAAIFAEKNEPAHPCVYTGLAGGLGAVTASKKMRRTKKTNS